MQFFMYICTYIYIYISINKDTHTHTYTRNTPIYVHIKHTYAITMHICKYEMCMYVQI